MDPRDPTDEIDVRDEVRTAGQPVPPAFRAEARDRIDAALRGETIVSVAPVAPTHRSRWLAAAAVLVAVGVIAGVVALADDEPGSVTPATLPPTTVPVTAAPTTTTVELTTVEPTTVELTVPPFTPLSADRTISVDSDLGRPFAGSTPLVSTAAYVAFFQDDGWTTWDGGQDTDPLVVSHYALDGSMQWKVAVPSTLQGLTRTGSIEIGPVGVLYVYYEGLLDTGLVAAVPFGGKRVGQPVATWVVPRSCYETFCGPPLAEVGIQVSDTEIAPFVDQNGGLVEATFTAPEYASVDLGQGPPVPADWPAFDENGNNLFSWRTTVTYQGTTWQFDAIGVNTQEGQYLAQRTSDEGSVLVWFGVTDGAGSLATRRQQVLGALAHDGTMEFLPLAGNVVGVRDDPQRLGFLVTEYDAATGVYTLARLVFSD